MWRSRWWWAKWVATIAIACLLVGEGIYLWPRLHESWRNLTEMHWWWLGACIFAQAISMHGYGLIQKQLLNAGSVKVTLRKSVSVVYAATGMTLTLPAGQVFSTAFTYRQTRRWGASPIVASWQLAMSGVIAAGGMALLGLGGAMLVGGSVSPFTLILSVAAIAALAWAARYASNHPDSIEAAARWGLAKVNQLRRQPADTGLDKVQEVLGQLESVDLRKRDAILTVLWAVTHRVGDVACLGFACYAVGAEPRIAGLMIAFAVGKAVGTIPFAPGGVVYVDATLIATLTSTASIPAASAVAAAFVYRAVSFILVAIVGWIVFAFLFRKHQHDDLQFDVEFEREEARRLRHPRR